MKKIKIIYWVTTSLLALMMIFSGVSYFTNEEVAQGFVHLGFPDYFRTELGIAKLLGAIMLITPQIPAKIKEWAYVGFGITFISAIIAHMASGDPVSVAIGPLVAFAILLASIWYFQKLQHAKSIKA